VRGLLFIKESQRLNVDPISLGKTVSPFGGCNIASLVPPRILAPVEKFPQTCTHILGCSAREQCLNHLGVTPWATNNRMEQRSVPAKAIGIDDCARIDIGAVREQPAENLPFSEINRSAVEGVLEIPRSELGDSLDDFEPAEIGSVAHRRSPVAAPHRKMQHLRVGPQNFNDGVAIIGANRAFQFVRCSTCGDAMLERGPIHKSVKSPSLTQFPAKK